MPARIPTTQLPRPVSAFFNYLRDRRALYAIVSFGVLIRIVPLLLVGGRHLAHENPSYDEMALQLIGNVKFSPYWPPGVPYYLAFFHEIFGAGTLVARASILVVYVCFSFALYALVAELSSGLAGNLAVLAFAFYPSYVRYAFNPSTEYPTAACLLAIGYLTVLILRRKWYLLAPALGFLLGALALIRANSLGLAMVVPAFLCLRTKRWRPALACALMSAILVSAWLWKAYRLTDRFVMINDSNEENFVFANHPDTPLYVTSRGGPIEQNLPASFLQLEREIDEKPSPQQLQVLRQATLHYILSRPDLFALRILNRFRAYFTLPVHHAEPLVAQSRRRAQITFWLANVITIVEAAFFWPIMALAIVFWFNLPSFPTEREAALVITGVAFIYAAPCCLTWAQPRYSFPVIPLFAVFAFVLLNGLLERPWREVLAPVAKSTIRRRSMLLALTLFFCIQVEWLILFISSAAWREPVAQPAVLSFLQF